MISILKRAWLFVKRYWKYFVFGIAVFVVILGSYWIKDNAKELQLYMKRYAIMKDKQKIDDLIIQKEIIKAKRDYTEDEIKVIDTHIKVIKKSIEQDVYEIEEMDMKQKLKKFDELGY